MKKIKITREEKLKFKKTENGKKKFKLMILGFAFTIIGSTLIGFLVGYCLGIDSFINYFEELVLLGLFVAILGSEFIGMYLGALEQFVIDIRKK